VTRVLDHLQGFRVQIKGDTATASDPFKVPTGKAGVVETSGDEAASAGCFFPSVSLSFCESESLSIRLFLFLFLSFLCIYFMLSLLLFLCRMNERASLGMRAWCACLNTHTAGAARTSFLSLHVPVSVSMCVLLPIVCEHCVCACVCFCICYAFHTTDT